MSRNTIALVWIGGLLLAVLVYLTGPDRFVYAAFDLLHRGWWEVQNMLRNLSLAAFDVVRALAIGLYFVFLALGLLVARRGGRSAGALVGISIVFVVLIWQAGGGGFLAHARWVGALVLAGAGALAMTRRLTQPGPAGWQGQGPLPPRPGA